MSTPDTGAPTVRALVTARHRRALGWAAVALMFAVLTAGMIWLANDQATSTRRAQAAATEDVAQGKVITDLSRDSQALRDALKVKGVNPDTIAPAPEVRVDAIPGIPGVAGVSVTRTALTAGRLQVFYSDGSSQTVGNVAGPPGHGGAPGRGVRAQAVVAGRLVVTYTDGSRTNLGPVVGAKGAEGVKGDTGAPGQDATDTQAAAAVLTYCDTHGLCRGPAGADSTVPGPASTIPGPDGEAPVSWVVVDDAGLSTTCVRDTPFDPAKPMYHCAPTP